MFLKNNWYVAAMSGEVGRELLARRILGEPVVLYRRQDGAPAALADRCPHRFAPLSGGTLVGDDVQCGYHGITFDGSGKCVRIPGQPNIPPRMKARAYPLVEKWNWIWIWMGEPAEADDSDIPDLLHWNGAPGWDGPRGYTHIEAGYQLLVDNLLDLSHESYVHTSTIGTDHVAETPVKTFVDGDSVRVERRMTDIPAPPMFVRIGDFTGNIDRWQLIEWRPPANIVIDVGGVPTGANDRGAGIEARVLNAITPESERSTHYFWGFARNFKLDDAEMTEFLHGALVSTFDEDKVILEAQQGILDAEGGDFGMVAANFDAGVAAARKVMARLQADAAGPG